MPTHSPAKSTRIHRPSNSRSSHQSTPQDAPMKPHLSLGDPGLARHGTLLTSNATPARAAAELKSVLGNHNSRLKSKAALIRLDSGSATFDPHVSLEQAKTRARVEVDILPQTNICVQGGHLRGHVKITIRKAAHKEGPIFIAGGKIRVIGFESLGDKSKSIFYQSSAMLTSVTPNLSGLYASEHDAEGFALAKEGEHELPFALYLSLSSEHGQAKGFLRNHFDIALNYIAMVSLKIKDEPGRRSIAHFYRSIEVWPRLDPTAILSPALRPLHGTVLTNISKDSGAGRIKLMASLHRLHWVAGQYCQVKIVVNNDTNRPLNHLTISLHRTITIFPHSSSGDLDFDLDTHQPEVISKHVVESVLEAGQSRSRGHASARGWWLGVLPHKTSEFDHSLLIPMDALTVPRGRIFEVEYSLRVAVDSGTRLSSDIQVILPIRIVGFYSIDPPPSQLMSVHSLTPLSSQPPSSGYGSKADIPDLSHLLSQSRSTSSPSKETQERISTEQFRIKMDEDEIVLHDSHDFLHKQDIRKQFSDCDGELGNLELGNLSLADDTDDVIQHAITTARMNSTYGRFSDLYYSQDKSNRIEMDGASPHEMYEHSVDDIDYRSATGALESLMEEVASKNDSNADIRASEGTGARHKFGRRSSFAARVEEKTRIANAAFLNGDRDTRVRQKQREDSPKCDIKGQRNRKPHLTLKISPVLGGKSNQSPGGLPHHRFDGLEGVSANSSNGPTQNDHSCSLDVPNAGTERRRNASMIDSLTSRTPSQDNICLPLAPPFRQGQSESTEMASAPICSHYVMQMSDNTTSRGVTPIRSAGRQGTPNRLVFDTNSRDDANLPRVDHPTTFVGAVKAATTSAKLTSPTSAASTTSTASVGNVSVKDKVRQLEERVKASTSLST